MIVALSGFHLTRPEERCSFLGEIRAWAQATAAAAENTEHDLQAALVTRGHHLDLILDFPHHFFFFFKLYVSILLLKVLNLNIVKTMRTKS